MKISIIVAIDEKRGIGKDNKIPWYISKDFKRFKKITINHPVVMGRKTFESIGKPLVDRTNIVISRNLDYKKNGIEIADSLENALAIAKKSPGNSEVFIIGGEQIFKQTIGLADKLYITKIKGDYNADTFFPPFSAFKRVVFEKKAKEGSFEYTFLELEK